QVSVIHHHLPALLPGSNNCRLLHFGNQVLPGGSEDRLVLPTGNHAAQAVAVHANTVCRIFLHPFLRNRRLATARIAAQDNLITLHSCPPLLRSLPWWLLRPRCNRRATPPRKCAR